MFTRHLVALVFISATASACPNDPAFVTTDDASTSEATTADAPTTAADSSTGGSSTGDSVTTSSTTGGSTTGTETVNCGEPADACTPTNREWCIDIANTCKQLGGGEQACNDALADCLCRAIEHGLDINN